MCVCMQCGVSSPIIHAAIDWVVASNIVGAKTRSLHITPCAK